MRLDAWNPGSPDWVKVLMGDRNHLDNTTNTGKIILRYQTSQNQRTMSVSFDTLLDGHTCLAVNAGGANSLVFESKWNPAKYEMMLGFAYASPEVGWKVALYTTREDVDCSVIAKAHGGGGHQKAAGFNTQDLSLLLPKKENLS
jgi:nanoRNase/pAp phosphatase (c-di-AMP/oligoRNAs hydrolase)